MKLIARWKERKDGSGGGDHRELAAAAVRPVACLVSEVERVRAAGCQMKENGDTQSITLYFELHWSRRVCASPAVSFTCINDFVI